MFLFIVTGYFLTGCSMVVDVVKISNTVEPNKKPGYFYALPHNYIKVEVVVDETELIKGPYADFSEKYLGLTNVIKSNSTNYEISEYKISSVAEPDPDQYYHVRVRNANCKKKNDFAMQLSESGLMINTTANSDLVKADKPTVTTEEEGNVYPDIFKSYTDLNIFEKIDTIIEKVSIDSGIVEKITFMRSMVSKTPEQKAKEAADFIIKVKENRFNLISGFQEVNYDKETFKHMNDELEKMETEYRKLFTGISFTKKITYSFYYLPDEFKPIDSLVLFKFSKLKGVLDTTHSYGEEVYLKIIKSGITDTLKVYTDKMNELKTKKHGFYYRIADYADISVLYEGDKRINARFLIPQYGVVCSMPALFNKYSYFPASGTIYKIGK